MSAQIAPNIQNACPFYYKQSYQTRALASAALARHPKRFKTARVYRCGNHYHIGRPKRRKDKR